MRKHKTTLVIAASIVSFLVAGLVMAQPQGGQRGQRGQGGRDPAEMRRMMEQRMDERMQEQLEVTDAEWKVIKPRFQKVTDLSRQAMGGGGGRGGMMGMMFGGRGGRGGQGGAGDQQRRPRPESDRPQNDVQKANEALATLLEGENPSPDQIKAKLAALRGAREKAKQQLATAQGELRQLLTLKQEASLVMMGIMP